MLKFAVIGAGPWGKKVEAAIKALRFDVECCTARGDAYRELIPRCDIVWVAAHPTVNIKIAQFALAALRPVVVEKPVAFNTSDVSHLWRMSQAKRVSFVVNYIHLFNDDLTRIRQEHAIGSFMLSVKMGGAGPVRDYSGLFDYGSHALSVALSFIRQPLIKITETGINEWTLNFGSCAAIVNVSNVLPEKTCEAVIEKHQRRVLWKDSITQNPLAVLISTMASKHLRGEYWTNGELAVEVTDLLERLHKT